MLHTVARAAGLLALLCPAVYSAAVPSQPQALPVPWKRNGIFSSDLRSVEERDGACTHGPHTRSCWGNGFSASTDPDIKWPNTGKTVTYNLEITNSTLAPDGLSRQMLLINGQYPGPVITADWGDTLSITVKNSLTNNGTGIHWHGFRQLGTNQMDGTNGITECPIAPGASKTYTFKATQYGTSWYHSHYSVQYGDGIVGGIVIKGPSTANYDIDLGILPFTDWFHVPSFTVNAAAQHAKGPPIADNILINGSMTSAFGGKYSVTNLTPGKKHLVRFVNSGVNNYIHVSLDGHPFTVIAADFIPIVPYTTTSLVIAVGQRYEVIIDANQPVGNYWLQVGTGGGTCDGPNANANNTKAIFHYAGANSANPNSTGITLPQGCLDETNIVPYVKTTVPQQLPKNLELTFSATAASGNLVQWLVNSSAMQIDFAKPTLQYLLDGNDTFHVAENVYPVGEANKWQYWVIQQAAGTPPLPHPIHLHGHDFYVLDHGENTAWTGDISKLKTDNPIRRDTATLPAGGYLVLAFESDNPGAWLMHCHIPFHVSAGLSLQFLERESEIIPSLGGDLSSFKEGCKSWKQYQDNVPGGFIIGDSGL
ncbi:multicopper oxidase-domain-containing protein [Clohesyomyces aquaticus]|uniref:Multicopper oxidase-domain-containing protein n=1 Tax=Clohesyomyces aquaticus TaxID=1231657 RepID=A0A1Y2A1L0_9PLEO|nr:multicopper oxidase-domain-containing protein [Clohesyomyces aquaticus]